MKLRAAAIILCWTFFGLLAHAQVHPISVKVLPVTRGVRPGEVVTIRVEAAIRPPFHIYSVVPVADPGPLATTIEVIDTDTKPMFTIEGDIVESAPTQKYDPGFKKEVGIHGPNATFDVTVRVASNSTVGSKQLTIKFRAQACDERGCLPPKSTNVPLNLIVEGGPVRQDYMSPLITTSRTSGKPMPSTVSNTKNDSWGAFLLTAFLAGLVTLLTPCVFPLIPVTLAFFTKLASKNEKPGVPAPSILRYALLYATGIITCFTGFGIVLSVVAGGGAARNFAINPWINLLFTMLFVVFGLALLEVTEIRLPSRLQQLSASSRGSTLGILGMGLTFVVSAFTCTAPIVGSLLVLAANASGAGAFIKPVVGMLVFSTALALPFVILSLFPTLMAKLPKSGVWLTTLKGSMGFLELVAAVKFLSTADMFWNWQLITRPVYLSLSSVFMIAGGLWLLGILRVGFNTPSGKVTTARGSFAAIFIGCGLYCMYGISGRPIGRFVAQFLPPPPSEYGFDSVKGADEVSFLTTLEEAQSAAVSDKKLVFVDITGHTCSNCNDVEQNVMKFEPVRSLLQQFVRVRLYTDSGRNATAEAAEKNAKYQLDTFQDVTLPRYAILDETGKVLGTTDYTTARDGTSFAKWLQATIE